MIAKHVLVLGIGHLLGDFYFQNEKIARDKEEKYGGVLFHSLEYYMVILLVILPVFSWNMVLAATYTAFMHFAIDSLKYMLLAKKKIRKSGKLFGIDQCAHIISIYIAAYIMNARNDTICCVKIVKDILDAYGWEAEILIRWLIAILLLHTPVNIFIQSFLGDYRPKSDESIIKADNKAGRRIGTVERLIMLAFLSMDQYTAMGFILTAKSIARYDKIAKDEKFAEYYLLGTLVSALSVIVCRMLILN